MTVITKLLSILLSVLSLLSGIFGIRLPVPSPDGAAKTLLSMTLEEKVGQMFMVTPEALMEVSETASLNDYSSAGCTYYEDAMGDALDRYHTGGVIMFYKNISTPASISRYIADLQSNSKLPLFIAVDEEGGIVARIGNNDNFDVITYDSMQSVGATGDFDQAYRVGVNIGTYLKKYGFNLDLAPVADINSTGYSVIGSRSFGRDPYLVGSMVKNAVEGFHSTGIMTCVKHFPGHGDTEDDTHDGYVAVNKSWEEMLTWDIEPFRYAIAAGTDFIMAAHITCRQVASDGLPASLSYEMLTNKLRKELGYDGLIITDALNMGAIVNEYTSAEAAVQAIGAGADIVLMPYDYERAYSGVLNAVKSGEISEARIDESVLRILSAKNKYAQ